MSQDELTLVCEGEPRGRDTRWLTLALGHLALTESFEPAARVRVVPSGSKADLCATVRGMREYLKTRRVYAIRDRDFLRTELLAKDVSAGVYTFERHCIESYLVEPCVLEAVFGVSAVEDKLSALAERRFWPDVGRAVLDAFGYELRRDRPSLGGEAPASEADVVSLVAAKIESFRAQLAARPLDASALVGVFARDMRMSPLWTRVHGKELLNAIENELRDSGHNAADLESRLFKWCSQNSPPGPLVAEVKRLLVTLLDLP
ncbi:hypothetical protein WMF30_26465 [Sorangium sp. So ce134]